MFFTPVGQTTFSIGTSAKRRSRRVTAVTLRVLWRRNLYVGFTTRHYLPLEKLQTYRNSSFSVRRTKRRKAPVTFGWDPDSPSQRATEGSSSHRVHGKIYCGPTVQLAKFLAVSSLDGGFSLEPEVRPFLSRNQTWPTGV